VKVIALIVEHRLRYLLPCCVDTGGGRVLEHNPDKYELADGLGYDFRKVCFTDETPACIGEECGMQECGAKRGKGMTMMSKRTATARTVHFNSMELLDTITRDLVMCIGMRPRKKKHMQRWFFGMKMQRANALTTPNNSLHRPP
jgi:hypothetical protein